MDDQRNHILNGGRWIFVGETVDVRSVREISEPGSFVWRNCRYNIAEILLTWFDWNFSAGAAKRNWRSRRHRKYFRVRTSCGEIFELYLDHKSRNPDGDWICYQQWEPENRDIDNPPKQSR
jgi:hypothetical protein